MKNILVVYASSEGQTGKIARRLHDEMASHGAQVTLVNLADAGAVDNLDLSGFDLLVFGASIHVGKIQSAMVDFINTNSEIIAAKPHALFVVLMAAATKDRARREQSLQTIRQTLDRQLQVAFPDPEMIAGAILYTRYNWFIRLVMTRIARKEGGSTDTSRDHEYTDWAQVAAYAQRLSG